MPKRKTYKRKMTKKRKYKKKISSMGVPSGIPLSRRGYLRYSESINIVSASGSLGAHLFRANSCHDPDYTGVGRQPMAWDEWKALYNHYCVVGSKIKVTVLSDSGTTSPFVVGVYLSDGTTLPYTNWNGYNEAKKGTQVMINGTPNVRTQSAVAKFSAKKYFNVTDIKDNFQRLGALTSGNPAELSYFVVYYQQIDTAISDTKTILITMDFIVDFSEPKSLALS